MLRIHVSNSKQNLQLEHDAGPIEFGRGPQRQVRRCIIDDDYVSRNQLTLEELPDGRVRVENLSERIKVEPIDDLPIDIKEQRAFRLPVCLMVGYTRIEIEPVLDDSLDKESLMTISEPLRGLSSNRLGRPLSALGDAPAPEVIAHWLETVITLQAAAAGATEFYDEVAQALVELVGLDLGLVLLRNEDSWTIAARHPAAPPSDCAHYSRTLLSIAVTQKRTFYQDLLNMPVQAESLRAIDAAVVSPIFGWQGEVVGALYGLRSFRGETKSRIRPLEAQVVQLLAASIGANLARGAAMRTRVQLEQFCSAELVRELERNPALLEANTQEVTVLVSDLRGFTAMSERLGAQTICRLVRDLMERLSQRIRERGGFVVDYAGDGLLAMWNAPVPQGDHAVRACRAALAMRGELPALNAVWQGVVGEPLKLGIGINTGPAQVGNTGTSHLIRYGPVGHTVNLASRVQDATKKLGVPLLLTSTTRDLLPANFVTTRVGRAQLPGVADGVLLFELQSETGSLP